MLDSLLLFWFVTEFITFVLDNLSFFLSFLYSSYNGMQKFKTTTHDIYGKKNIMFAVNRITAYLTTYMLLYCYKLK